MNALAPEMQIVALALAASLAVGLPVRLLGAGTTVSLLLFATRFARHHKFALLGLAAAGSLAGLWSFESVRELIFALPIG